MKKAHIFNLTLFLIAYIIPFFLNTYLPFDRDQVNNVIKYIVIASVFILVLLPSIYFLVSKVFSRFIKHNKKIKLGIPRLITFIVTILATFTFIFFKLEYYYYFGSILILYIFYFIFLIFIDSRYIKTSQENKITINDELINNFLSLLGGKDNIVHVSYESSRLKVEVKNIKVVNLEKIKELGAQGLFVAGNKLQAIVGNNASELENAIKKYLTIV